jgi:PAT family beta-lactamase induction signal transducer AmpG
LTQAAKGWRDTLAAGIATYGHARVLAMLALGFSSGLPFPLLLPTLSARLRQAGIDRTTIGYFSLVGLAFSLKYFWAPVVDRVRLPLIGRLGQRRSWMLLAQLGLAGGLLSMAAYHPIVDAAHMAWLAIFTALFAATQDIAIDAYRIEALSAEWQGSMAAAYQIGYQLALICAGAGALHAAATGGWGFSYFVMAALTSVGLLTTLLIADPTGPARRAQPDPALVAGIAARLTPLRMLAVAGTALGVLLLSYQAGLFVLPWVAWVLLWIYVLAVALVGAAGLRYPAARPVLDWTLGAVVLPFADFFRRKGWRVGLPILALVITYRLNYSTMGVAANPFYLDMGYTLDQIAVVSKVYGVLMTLGGALLAGALVKRIGIPRTLLIGWVLLSLANLLYAWVATLDHPGLDWLAGAVSLDNLGNGIAGTAFIAWMSSLTSSAYTATQYALFGTLWSLPAKSIASQWGRIVDTFGYPPFFVYTAAVGVPALLLVFWMMRQPAEPDAERVAAP